MKYSKLKSLKKFLVPLVAGGIFEVVRLISSGKLSYELAIGGFITGAYQAFLNWKKHHSDL